MGERSAPPSLRKAQVRPGLPGPAAENKGSLNMEKTLKKYFPVFVLPTLAAFIIGFIVPFSQGLYLSFCKFTTVNNATWVGVSNYVRALSDDTFSHAFWFTVAFAAVSTVLINVLAFSVALALTRNIRGTNVFRTVFFMPNLIGGIVLGYIWQILINCLLSKLALPLLALNTTAGYWGLIILMCWQQIGYMMIIYIAGLQNVPPELLEASQIDGATPWQTLWRIKLPMVMPSLTICLFLTITNSFKLFDQNLSLTGGDPNHASEMLALNIYNTFYGRSGPQWRGIGQAKAVVFFILVVVIALAQLRSTRSREVQQ
jgi:raffinose/stachyose/melibiose transport system permease protein